MRFTLTRSAITTGVAALAGAATAAAILVAVPASAKPAAPASSAQVVLVQCNGKGAVKPATYDAPFCNPSNQLFSGLKWTSWKSNAFGNGSLKVNNCVPNCASGKYINFPILVVLWGAKAWPHHSGREYFSEFTLIFTGKHPQGIKTDTQTFKLSATGAP